jgi:hypothetical protein
VPVSTFFNGAENHSLLVLADSRVQYSIACPLVERRMLPDGRMAVTVQLRNRENHSIQLQVVCVFKDVRNEPLEGDATALQNVTINENSTTPVQFVSQANNAARFAIRIRPPAP